MLLITRLDGDGNITKDGGLYPVVDEEEEMVKKDSHGRTYKKVESKQTQRPKLKNKLKKKTNRNDFGKEDLILGSSANEEIRTMATGEKSEKFGMGRTPVSGKVG